MEKKDKGQDEFEFVSHENNLFNVFIVEMLQRNQHLHKDMEILYLMDGELTLSAGREQLALKKGDICLVESYQAHQIVAASPCPMLTLQILPQFFRAIPYMENLVFEERRISPGSRGYREIRDGMLEIGELFWKKPELYELKSSALVNELMYRICLSVPYRQISLEEREAKRWRGRRMREILAYIDDRYSGKLLLADVAAHFHLSLSYMSHFFKDSFDMSFQEYLAKMRCEKARQLLMLTDLPLLDISVECGFSDLKYMNRGFAGQFGTSPRDYRRKFRQAQPAQRRDSILTTQNFLSESMSIRLLEEHREELFRKILAAEGDPEALRDRKEDTIVY